MSIAYTRPFHPLDFARQTAAMFSLADMIDQLRNEPVYRSANRNALTLIHDDGLTAVLTVVREGSQCEEHFSPDPTIFVVLGGQLEIESAGERICLTGGSAGAVARGLCHKLTATTDCAYLMVMGHSLGEATSEQASGMR